MIMPGIKILMISLSVYFILDRLKIKIAPNIIVDKAILYHTSSPSLRSISFPRIAVKPARRTERCKYM